MPKNLGLDHILRYGYGGFLLLAVSLLCGKTGDLKPAVEAAGTVLAPLVVFACGAAIYVVYRYLFGEWLLFPIAHGLDWLTSKGNRTKGKAVSPIWYFVHLGVPVLKARATYNAVRREKLKEPTEKRLTLAHSEAHLLYLTAVVAIASYWIIADKIPLLTLGLVALFAALANDIRQHREELPSIRADVPEQDLITFFKARGFVP